MDKDKIKDIIEKIFTHTACSLTSCEFSEDNGILWCMIETPDSKFMIGREGETLKSLNHLVQKIVDKEKDDEDFHGLFIDINGYNKKKFDNLKAVAHMMAERARYFKSNIEVDPMPAYERKIIHMYLEGAKDIKTESEGFGAGRRVVIKYVGDQNI